MQNVRKGVISNIVEENVLQPLLVSTRCARLSRHLLLLLLRLLLLLLLPRPLRRARTYVANPSPGEILCSALELATETTGLLLRIGKLTVFVWFDAPVCLHLPGSCSPARDL